MRSVMEVKGGVDPNHVSEGGAVYEVVADPNKEIHEEDETEEYFDNIKNYTRLECLELIEPAQEEPSGANIGFDQLALEMKNLTVNEKVKKRVLRQGYGPTPAVNATVKIHYNIYIECEALPVDSTHGRKQPFSFTLGNGDVIEGLDVAVSSMQIHEKSEFLIHPDMAYKDSGLKRIPPKSLVLFEIEMLDSTNTIQSEVDKSKERTFSVVYDYCVSSCTKAKRLFKMQDFSGAAKEYDVALYKLENAILSDYSDQEKSDEMVLKLLTNLLICHTNTNAPKRGCSCANRIYDLVKNHETLKPSARVYYNNAKCLVMLGDLNLAKRRLHLAKKYDPYNSAIDQELAKLAEAERKYKEEQKAFGSRLFK